MFTTAAGRGSLATIFAKDKVSADWFAKKSNQAEFAGNGVASFPAQSNDPSCTEAGCNIAKICAVMTDVTVGTPVERLAKLRYSNGNTALSAPSTRVDALDLHLRARQRVAMRRQQRVRALTNGTALSNGDAFDYWGYQTCNEFGFYQTCEVGTQCFFTQGLDLLPDQDSFCSSEFNIEVPAITASIAATNAFYGGLHPESTPSFGSRLLYPNGNVDPWHGLSILTPSPEGNISTLMVEGASHHAWTHNTLPTDQVSLRSLFIFSLSFFLSLSLFWFCVLPRVHVVGSSFVVVVVASPVPPSRPCCHRTTSTQSLRPRCLPRMNDVSYPCLRNSSCGQCQGNY
jgi:hypothetical protein